MLPLADRIRATLAYFDIFDVPLTPDEVRRFLWGKGTLQDSVLEEALAEEVAAKRILFVGGYYCLPGRGDLVEHRERSYRLSQEKLQRGRRAIRKLRLVPFIEAIFVTNTVAMQAATLESDIDLLILVKPGRLWIARFFTLLMLDLFRLRPKPGHTANAICACFFLSTEGLHLKSIAFGEPDIYLVYWLMTLMPIYDPKGWHAKLAEANRWTQHYTALGMSSFVGSHRLAIFDKGWMRAVRRFFETAWSGGYGTMIEEMTRKIQKPRVDLRYGELRDLPDTRVVVNTAMLKFHKNDRRAAYRAAWQERLRISI